MKLIIVSLIGLLMLQGCTWLAVGKNQSHCEDNGKDYSEAGVCWSVMQVTKNSDKALKASYRNYSCKPYLD
jgi:hypothetical protein